MAVVEQNHHLQERETEENTLTTATTSTTTTTTTITKGVVSSSMSRKEKRKALKKLKRKQIRREIAMREKEEEEARLNDPEEQIKLLRLEKEEAEKMARDRVEFEERERKFLIELELKKKKQEEEEEERRKVLQQHSRNELVNKDVDEDDGWEYIEEGPAEIIWKGNEIIVKKKTIRVPKKAPDIQKEKQESERPISNPLAPQSEAYEEYRSAKEVLESVAQQVPNFGTEQDKAHCPFHLKTGVCRFGARCSRVHFYPDKACTILIKNMYNGPGLAWEQDEGLEHTDEEVQRSFEDFYEDVHTEFLKFGEIVNFKVCKNGSSHLRGNVYVHYKTLESAMLAYQSINGRYFAGKLLTCEFVNLTRWRVAICGEYMKSRLKNCSRGSACNFIHCFRNPGGDYEWADWDKPAPKYWLKKMAGLFGYTSDGYTDEISPGSHSRRSRSRGLDSPHRRGFSNEDTNHKRKHFKRHKSDGKEDIKLDDDLKETENTYRDQRNIKHRETYHDETSEGSINGHGMKRKRKSEQDSIRSESKSKIGDFITTKDEFREGRARDRYIEYRSRSSSSGSDESRDVRVEKRELKNRKEHSRLKNKNEISDSYGIRQDRCVEKRSRERKYDSGSSDDGDRLEKNEKRSQKNERRSKRTKHHLSDRDEHRRYRHSRKHSRKSKYDEELSDNSFDGDKHRSYDEKRFHKSRSSRSKNESERERSREKIDERERHPGHRSVNDCYVSNDDSIGKDKESSCQDYGKANTELEKACRNAALMKLEEIRKNKETQATTHCKDPIESSRMLAHENMVDKGVIAEKSGSSKSETSVASTKRKRI